MAKLNPDTVCLAAWAAWLHMSLARRETTWAMGFAVFLGEGGRLIGNRATGGGDDVSGVR